MRIIIKEKGKMGIRLWLPNRMIFSNTAAKMIARQAREAAQEADDIEEEAFKDLILEDLEYDDRESMGEEAFEGSRFSGNFLASLPDDKLKEAMRILRRMKKDHPGVPLVDVKTGDGTRVLIQL